MVIGLDGNLTPEQNQLLDTIRINGEMILYQINNTLTLYHIERGTYIHEPAPFDLLYLLKVVIQSTYPLSSRKKIGIEITVNEKQQTEKAQLILNADQNLTYLLVLNLIKNAVEASPEKGKVRVDIGLEEGVLVRVINSGVIPEEIRDSFFEKYVTAGKSSGTGLGTYSARLMANAMKAEIWFETGKTDQTVLFVKFPESGELTSGTEQEE
jgi:signal transduction histidine kinase